MPLAPADPHVALVGLMATGKTSVGHPLATALGRNLVDSDPWIEARTGQTVRELWQAGGEAAYRPLEHQHVLEALDQPQPLVVAAAAGTILDADVRARLVQPDVYVVWLRAEPVWLAARATGGGQGHRPLLAGDPVAAFRAMADERSGLYGELADATIDVDLPGADAESSAAAILAAYRLR